MNATPQSPAHPAELVLTPDGLYGRAELIPGDPPRVLVTFDDGRSMVVPQDLIRREQDGTYRLAVPVNAVHSPAHEASPGACDEVAVIPVLREELRVGKRVVERRRGVRIHKRVMERVQEVVQLLYREALDVEHVPKNEIVERPPAVRYEGTTMVIPLCEEVLVIEKRLLLKEEVRVSRREGEVRHAESVVLRSEQAVVERFDEEEPSDPRSAVAPARRARDDRGRSGRD